MINRAEGAVLVGRVGGLKLKHITCGTDVQ